ncbi:MAG: NAD(P)-dependent alcohol dehydrogenase, partial [Bacteroidota bacterium]
ALTAFQALRDLAKVKAGHKVYLHGASGGVGVYAIQIAKAMGAEVTASCSYRNTDRLLALGADKVIDYTKEDIVKVPGKFHLFYDIYGNQSYGKSKHLLTSRGYYVSTIPSPANFLASFFTFFARKKAKVVLVKSLTKDLDDLSQMIEKEQLKSVIDQVFTLKEAVKAQEYLETRRAKGKILLEIR